MQQAKQKKMKLRGWMLDAARLLEKKDYYYRVIDMCAQWDINAIVFRVLADDACALRLKSHPDLRCHPNAFSVSEMKALVKHADNSGVMLIPEVESFGHSSYITSAKKYSHLLDKRRGQKSFTGLIPVHPDTIRLMKELYREVSGIFTAPYLHGGCDEVNWGGSAMSRRAIAQSSRGAVMAGYFNTLNDAARKEGRELILWADHITGHSVQDDLLEQLDKSIILHDWNYWDHDPAVVTKRLNRATELGMRVIGGPAWGWCRWGSRPGRDQLYNIDAYADACLGSESKLVLGVLTTNWCPYRYMSNAIWDGLVYSAVAMNGGSKVAGTRAFRLFVEKHYGAEFDNDWSAAFQMLYSFIPQAQQCSERWRKPLMTAPWGNEDEFFSAAFQEIYPPPFTELRSVLARCAPTVLKNESDFLAVCLNVETLEHIYLRNTILYRECEAMLSDPDRAGTCLKMIAERDRRILEQLEKEWDSTRYENDLLRKAVSANKKPGDKFVRAFARAAAFSAKLAAKPELARSIIKRVHKSKKKGE